MKTIKAAVAALCLFTTAAAAQETPASPWSDPLGRFSVDFAGNGFSELPPAVDDAAQVIAVEHGALQRSANAARMCAIRESRVPRMVAIDQGQANAHLYALAERDIAARFGGQLSEYGRARIGGVSLIAFRLDAGQMQQYWRVFYLARDGGVVQAAIACGGAGPLSMLDISVMNQTLETLRFLPEARP